jgi:chemotaxis response regulator CheB
MAINILLVYDSAVMRKIIRRTINLCGLDIGNLYEAGNEGLKELKDTLLICFLLI